MFRDRFNDRPFGSIFRQLEEEMAEMERRADRLMRQALESGNSSAGPYVWGWTYERGPDGEPQIQRFGNLAQDQEALEAGWREPFVTSFVDREEHQLHVTAELPGVHKDDIEIECRADEVRIQAEAEDRKYRKRLRVGEDLDPDSAEATYNNGILEITCGLASPKREGKKVDVN